MKKTIIFILFFFVTILFSNLNIKAASDAYNIITNPGEDMATMININYHSDVEGSIVEYTKVTDTTYANSQKVNGECLAFSIPTTSTVDNKLVETTGFTERKNCQVSLTNLEPGTKYKYRVGTTSSLSTASDYFFETAGNTNRFSFLYLTDPQYADAGTASNFNRNVEAAINEDNNIRFSIISGDVIDRGGIMSYWNQLFAQSSLKKIPYGIVPGNHEYYSANQVSTNNMYYNGFLNNPDNGAEGVKNSNYFFKYDNVLFIGIDSEAAAKNAALMQAQKEWFANVIESNFSQYIVVFMHRSFYGSVYASDSVNIRANWQPLFDKYGVDLAVTGHDHVYCRTKSVYNGEASTDPYNGTIYMIGGSGSGGKFYSLTPNPLFDKAIENKNTVQIFSVTESNLSLKTLSTNSSGVTEIVDEVVIPAKRAAYNSMDFNKETFFDGITLKLDTKDQTKALVSWGYEGYTHLNGITLVDKDNNVFGLDYIHQQRIRSFELTNIEANRIYEYTLKATFKDNTSLEKAISLSTKPPFGTISNLRVNDTNENDIKFMWDATLQNNQIDKFKVYIDDVLFSEVEETITSVNVNQLSKYKENNLKLEAIDVNGDIVFTQNLTYGVNTDPVTIDFSKDSETVKVGETSQLTVVSTPNQALTYRYTSKNPDIVTVDANGKITGVKVGTATIEVYVAYRKDVKAEITVVVEAANVEEPIDEPKGGCGNSAKEAFLIPSFLALGAVLLFVRRRKY